MRSLALGLCVGLVLATGAAAQDRPAENAQLRDALNLTAAQQQAWRAYTAAIAPSPEMLARHRATDLLLPQVDTPRRIALIEAAMTADGADFHRQGEAVKAFYAELSPDQRRTFDQQTGPTAAAAR